LEIALDLVNGRVKTGQTWWTVRRSLHLLFFGIASRLIRVLCLGLILEAVALSCNGDDLGVPGASGPG
jgi:hypothetical protein